VTTFPVSKQDVIKNRITENREGVSKMRKIPIQSNITPLRGIVKTNFSNSRVLASQ
jgi:hypothetical protein